MRKMEALPDFVVIDPDLQYSSLVAKRGATDKTLDTVAVQPGIYDRNWSDTTTRCFRLLPDGSTDLPTKDADGNSLQWFLTLHMQTQTGLNGKNWLTVSIDPANGGTGIFRP